MAKKATKAKKSTGTPDFELWPREGMEAVIPTNDDWHAMAPNLLIGMRVGLISLSETQSKVGEVVRVLGAQEAANIATTLEVAADFFQKMMVIARTAAPRLRSAGA